MSYERTVAFSGATGGGGGNDGSSFYPGALLDDPGVNNNVWLGSGKITNIDLALNAAAAPAVEIYDFCDRNTGRPLGDIRTYLLGGGAGIAALFDGLDPATGDAFGTPRFECFNTADAADRTNAYVRANAKLVWASQLVFGAFEQIPEIGICCPHGMAVQLVGANIVLSQINITYVPWSTGGMRKKVSDRSVSGRVEQLPVL